MRRMVKAFNDGDVSEVGAFISVRYVDHQGIGGAAMEGPIGFAEVVMISRKAHPNLRVDINKLAVHGDTVEAELFWYELDPARVSDSVNRYQKRTREIVRFEDGLAVEHWGERID